MKRQSVVLLLPIFLVQLLLIGLLIWFNTHPEFNPPFSMILTIVVIGLIADIIVFRLYRRTIRVLRPQLYVEGLRDPFRRLLKPYQTLAVRQRQIREEVHDVLNAQFSYHALLSAGKPEEAEEYRRNKQAEWKKEEAA